jgi:hypothetical protein
MYYSKVISLITLASLFSTCIAEEESATNNYGYELRPGNQLF